MRRLCYVVLAASAAHACPILPDADPRVREALAAESRLDTRRALELFLAADKARPNDAFLLQKIARQYSDLVLDLPTTEEKKAAAHRALMYAQRAVALEPNNAVNVLSLAVCHGKLALFSDAEAKVAYSRLIKAEAERALALNPHYAWAHHVLGRWHHEVSGLGVGSRVFVRIFHGGLAGASNAAAVHHLSRAVELEPDELEHHLELGFALLAGGEGERARAAFARGLTMPSRAKHDTTAKERARIALAKLTASAN
jgi:tetratricopeptide (TPR) repeat protein